MPQDDPIESLDSMARQLGEFGDWKAAVQTKAQAGTIAFTSGRSDLFEKLYEEAIALACAHRLRYLELSLRLRKSQFLLAGVRSGKVVDNLLAGAKSKDGELAGLIRNYSDAVLAGCSAITTPEISDLADAVGAAAEAADGFELNEIGCLLASWRLENGSRPPTPEALRELSEIAGRMRDELAKRRDTLLTEAYLLRAALKAVYSDYDSQIEILNRALPTAAALPASLAQVHMALADAYCARAEWEKTYSPEAAAADLEQAERAAGEALAAVAPTGSALLEEAPTAKLNEVRALRISGVRAATSRGSQGFYGMAASVQGALQALADNRPAEALPLIDEALHDAPADRIGMALRVRAVANYELGRYEDAVRDLDECLEPLERQVAADSGELAYALNHRLREMENLCDLKACALTRLGRDREAWESDERGRTVDLRHPAAFDTWRVWRKSERAAFVSFAMTRWGTLLFYAGPDDAQPSATLLPSFRYGDLAKEFFNLTDEDSTAWTGIIFDAVPTLSRNLLHPIEPFLESITAGAEVLYILPDSYLFRVPFAALTLSDGRYLGDLCPLATAPSAAFVLWNAGRRRRSERSCLALGTGQAPKDNPTVRFSEQAQDVADLWTDGGKQLLLDGAATVGALRQAASSFDVLHLACHGTTSSRILDPMGASQLEMADRIVTAGETLGWKLDADLVFLNVCQGGRFRMEGRTQLNGFIRAFHTVGARSVIASVTHIDPTPAGELALLFYRQWLAGATKARALQRAQRELRKVFNGPSDWASHSLTGDYL